MRKVSFVDSANDRMDSVKVAIIGAGSWGTALSQAVARNGHIVSLWARRESVADGINSAHRNPDYLTDIELLPLISASTDLRAVISDANAVIVVMPSKTMRQTAVHLARVDLDSFEPLGAEGRAGIDIPLLLCTKGVERETGKGPVGVFAEVLGNPDRIACLSGPNHAEEVVCGLPAATVIASSDNTTALFFQEILGSMQFRVYTSEDTIGVELCGAAKNVIAIAVGVSYGLGYGDNTAAMIMTRGQAEMSRLIDAAGGNPLTVMGLAGTGDLIATCMSQHSRNRTFGEALAAGESLDSYEARRHMVVEGAQACKSLSELSAKLKVELPLVRAVESLIWQGADPREVASELSLRSLKPEFY